MVLYFYILSLLCLFFTLFLDCKQSKSRNTADIRLLKGLSVVNFIITVASFTIALFLTLAKG